MTKYRIIHTLCITAGVMFNATGAKAQDSTVSDTIQFNALNYVLQPIAKNERFAKKKFGDHLFLTGEIGPSWHNKPGTLRSFGTSNVQVAISAGDWFTPVHGARLSINAGYMTDSHKDHGNTIGFSLDYLMNLSSLAGKDNPYRKFEFIGVLGAEYQALNKRENWEHAGGFRFGMQARYNVTPSTFIYIEPRIGIYSDRIDGEENWRNYDLKTALMFGVGYRIPSGNLRNIGVSKFESEDFGDNMFYGIGFGGTGIFYRDMFSDISQNIGPIGSIFIGKWFTPSSGLRIQATMGSMGKNELGHQKLVIGDIDYMWNINSALAGYRVNRKFNTNIGIGATLAYPDRHDGKLYPGLGLSLQGVWSVTPNLGIYIEPRARFFGKNFSSTVNDFSKDLDVLASVNVGLQYRIDASGRLVKDGKYGSSTSNLDREYYDKAKKYFMTLGAGTYTRSFSSESNNLAIFAGVGKWFTPVSAWRLSADYEYHTKYPKYMSIALSADYMLSLSSLSNGFDPDRLFDISLTAGLYGGVNHYNYQNKFIYGAKAGLQGRFNISKTIDLFIEPQVLALRIPGYDSRDFTPEARIMAGITYKLGGYSKQSESKSSSTDKKETFVSLSAGPSLFSENFVHKSQRKISYAADLSIGRWLTQTSGVQVGLGYDFIRNQWTKTISLGDIHLDYLLNFSSLFDENPDRRFNIIGTIGAGIAWSNYEKSNDTGWSAKGSLQFRWELDSGIDLYLEPTMTLWDRDLCALTPSDRPFAGVGRLMAGVAYRF